MVAPAVSHRETLTSDLLRAMDRAKAERLVIFKVNACTLGVATVAADFSLSVRPYTLTTTGEGAGELTCNCPAASNGRCCKHLSAGIAARKWGVYAKAPQTTTSAALEAGRAAIRAELAAGINPLSIF